MNKALLIALWSAIIGALILPALSNVGYWPINIEYLFALSVSCILGALLAALSRIRYLNMFILLLLTEFFILLYFIKFLLDSYYLSSLIILFLSALAIFAYRRFYKALMLVGIAAFSQILVAAITTSTYIISLKEVHVAHSKKLFPVIHILLDEHGSMPAIPADAVSQDKLRAFQDDYVKHGFVVFSHAYSSYKYTNLSLPQLFNVNNTLPQKELSTSYDEYQISYVPNARTYDILKTGVFDEIGKKRAIDITQIEYINFNPALQNNPAVSRNLTYNVHSLGDFLYSIKMKDRLILADSLVTEWLAKYIGSPIAEWLFSRINVIGTAPEPHAISSLVMLRLFKNRLDCCGQRGTYYFIHLLLPHEPYVFNKNCALLPINKWDKWKKKNASIYRIYFEQASCTKNEVLKLVDSMAKKRKMADAVIFVHGDHGDRIQRKSELSMRGSFLAVKIPGMQGRVIDTPVRLDILYKSLLENDFRSFDLKEMPTLNDSPY